MKMEDVFKLPALVSRMDDEHAGEITHSGEDHYCIEDDAFWMASNFEHIEAAVHAINCHDELVDALETISRHIINMPLCDSHLYDWVEKTLQPILVKVKGEQ